MLTMLSPLLQIVAEAENRAPKDAGLGEKSMARLTALSVPVPPESNGSRSGSVAPAPQQVLSADGLPFTHLSSCMLVGLIGV